MHKPNWNPWATSATIGSIIAGAVFAYRLRVVIIAALALIAIFRAIIDSLPFPVKSA